MKQHNLNDNKAVTETSQRVYTVSMETGKILKNQNNNRIEECKQKFDNKNHVNPKSVEQSSTRTLRIDKNEIDAYGFHITRTKWDPYPWVSR